MPRFTSRQRHTACFGLAVLAALGTLTACSGAGNTTCDQYAAKSFSDQGATARDLLGSHNLEPYSVGNTVGITKALSSFCGITGLGNEKASKNKNTAIDKAVNWSAKNW